VAQGRLPVFPGKIVCDSDESYLQSLLIEIDQTIGVQLILYKWTIAFLYRLRFVLGLVLFADEWVPIRKLHYMFGVLSQNDGTKWWIGLSALRIFLIKSGFVFQKWGTFWKLSNTCWIWSSVGENTFLHKRKNQNTLCNLLFSISQVIHKIKLIALSHFLKRFCLFRGFRSYMDKSSMLRNISLKGSGKSKAFAACFSKSDYSSITKKSELRFWHFDILQTLFSIFFHTRGVFFVPSSARYYLKRTLT